MILSKNEKEKSLEVKNEKQTHKITLNCNSIETSNSYIQGMKNLLEKNKLLKQNLFLMENNYLSLIS